MISNFEPPDGTAVMVAEKVEQVSAM